MGTSNLPYRLALTSNLASSFDYCCTFFENITSILVNYLGKRKIIFLKAKKNQTALHQLVEVRFNSSGHVPAQEAYSGPTTPAPPRGELPRELEETLGSRDREGGGGGELDLSRVDESVLELTDEDRAHLGVLRQQLEEGELTEKGFHAKRARVLRPHVRRHLAQGGRMEDMLVKEEELPKEEEQEEEVSRGLNGTSGRRLLWIKQDRSGEDSESRCIYRTCDSL